MDLGCLDLGCVSLCTDDDQHGADLSGAAAADSLNSKVGPSFVKNKPSKVSPHSSTNALNRFTSQIKKPPHRKTSPLNWFPRKKVDSYLKRKIKLLQEAGGMNSTLDETLGDANPHYCRVEREKIAAREAARKAMEARKAAMIEASWCRILRAARIQSKEAEAMLLNAEKNVAEALEAATAKGVIMYDRLDCPRKNFMVETSTVMGRASTTHTIRASFETGFDVDKQVAAALKTAFIRLANCPPSSNEDDFKELMRRISEKPDTSDSEFSSECESDMELESEIEAQDDEDRSQEGSPQSPAATRPMRLKARQSPQKYNLTYLIDMMFERLKCLQEDELASLATIVATSGLNVVLAEVENHRSHDQSSPSTDSFAQRTSANGAAAIRNSSMDYFMNGPTRKKQVEPEVLSLDKFLVKHMTKLEREREEAKNSMKHGSIEAEFANPENSGISSETVPDLGSMLVRHSSKLEKEIQEMKQKQEAKLENNRAKTGQGIRVKEVVTEAVPSLDKCLVKHLSRLEREVQEAKSKRREELAEELQAYMSKANAFSVIIPRENSTRLSGSDQEQDEKENYDVNMKASLHEPEAAADRKGQKSKNTTEDSRLSGQAQEQRQKRTGTGTARKKKQQGEENAANYESLDKVLVKRVSRLDKEKMELRAKEEESSKVRVREKAHELNKAEGGLDQILVKHKSRLEREKMTAAQYSEEPPRHSVSRQEARERELQEAWGGISLGNSMKPHVSRLEEVRGRDEHQTLTGSKHSEDPPRHSVSRREAREKELREAWGGVSLGNSIKPHVSRLVRDKAAWLKAEEDERKAARQELL